MPKFEARKGDFAKTGGGGGAKAPPAPTSLNEHLQATLPHPTFESKLVYFLGYTLCYGRTKTKSGTKRVTKGRILRCASGGKGPSRDINNCKKADFKPEHFELYMPESQLDPLGRPLRDLRAIKVRKMYCEIHNVCMHYKVPSCFHHKVRKNFL